MQESKIQALDEGNRAVARPRGKEAGVKTASPRTEMCSEAGGPDELAPHNEVPDSRPQVKHGVVPGKFTRLLGETCPAGAAPVGQSAVAGNSGGQRAGVSRGHSSAGNEPGVGRQAPTPEPKDPEGLTHARRTELVGTAETAAASRPATKPDGGAGPGRTQAAETDRGQDETWRPASTGCRLPPSWHI
jgi:hypothetical protein